MKTQPARAAGVQVWRLTELYSIRASRRGCRSRRTCTRGGGGRVTGSESALSLDLKGAEGIMFRFSMVSGLPRVLGAEGLKINAIVVPEMGKLIHALHSNAWTTEDPLNSEYFALWVPAHCSPNGVRRCRAKK